MSREKVRSTTAAVADTLWVLALATPVGLALATRFGLNLALVIEALLGGR